MMDSSDEENDEENTGNSPRKPTSTMRKPATTTHPPPPKRLKQTDVRAVFTIKVEQVLLANPAVSAPAVEPPLDQATAAGRYVFVPRELWPDVGGPDIGGWIGKIMKVNKSTKLTHVKFHDGNQYFHFETVAKWKPLS
jgi:hypothetical protein